MPPSSNRPMLYTALSARFEEQFIHHLQHAQHAPPTQRVNDLDSTDSLATEVALDHERLDDENAAGSADDGSTNTASAIPNGKRIRDDEKQREEEEVERPSETRDSSHVLSSLRSRIMAIKRHTWVSLWFLVTIPVIFWDAGYCFMRPRSMVGGDLHWIWKPYALYQDIDYVYGIPALQRGDGFTNAQSLLNLVENFMNIFYLYLAHVAQSPVAPLLGFASVTMTLSKTVLYWAQEYYCGGCSVGHNDLKTLIVYWVIPNGLWLVVPSLILTQFWKDIAGVLRTVDAQSKKVASGKKQ
ncbi:hypothetical protein K474DRAFT_1664045 [Panus rudis PR-1116 ss-1]|nr:hypothetical protein K474DRAFT_1664045 [Panus rudis PR-1116 ss-1]